jgi:hypothetical protein
VDRGLKVKYSLKEVYGISTGPDESLTRKLMEEHGVDPVVVGTVQVEPDECQLLHVTEAITAIVESVEGGDTPVLAPCPAHRPAPTARYVRDDEALRRWREMAGI